MGILARVRQFNWTIERKLVASFTAAILVGFLIMIGLQARDQRASLVDLAVSDLTAKTTQLGNAMRIGFMGHDGSAIETEYKPIADAADSQLASLASFQDDGTLILKFANEKLTSIDLTGILKDAPDLLAKGTPLIKETPTHLIVAVPVMSLRGTKVIGALAIAWSLDAQNAAVTKALRNQTAVALVVMIVLLGILALLLRRMVVRPIRGMTEVMRRLAGGETDIQIPAAGRQDEIGAMAASVTVFRDTAADVARIEAEREEQKRQAEDARRQSLLQLAARLESSVKTVADSVAGAANEVERSARSMAEAAQTATSQTSAVAAASEETSVSIQTVAAAAEELTASIGELGRQAAGSASVAEGAVQEAGATSSKVEHLETAAGRIGEVVKLINDIAS
ncbi:MAG TPA: methyl-accepting chemotaxis protein, partial [Aliidongia sp.]|nr:methyl-accepting chemotaxis protein [Aliidongia sp.]